MAVGLPNIDPSKWGDYSDILQNLMQNKLKSESQAETGKYHQGILDIYKQQEGRLGALQPLQMDLLKEKIESEKRRGNGNGTLTKPVITLNQKTIQSIDNLNPQIDNLISSGNEIPGQLAGKYIHPSEQTKYESNIAKMAENYISAFQLPKTNQSLKLVEKVLTQGKFESREDYKNRMQDLKQELMERRNRSSVVLEEGGINTQQADTGQQDNNDPLGIR